MTNDICHDMVRKGDPDRYLSAMLAPDPAGDALVVLYAFNLEIARAPWASSEEMIAEMRLQWWADAIGSLFAGKTPEHPVMGPLADVIAEYDLPQNLFDEMVQARRFDIYRDGHPDRVAFDRYINVTSGHLMHLAARILKADEPAQNVMADFAYAAGVANLFRALPELYARGRHPIPVACALDRNAVAEGRVDSNLEHSLREISQNALENLARARRARHLVPAAVRSVFLAASQPDVPLRIVRKNPANALRVALETSPFRKKANTMWRATTGRW